MRRTIKKPLRTYLNIFIYNKNQTYVSKYDRDAYI